MFEHIKIIMVETAHPGNIGSAARAMKTMGLENLVLVNPQYYPCEQATWMASGAKDVLEKAVVVPTLAEAISDCQFVIGTSARNRRIPWPMVDPRACGQVVVEAVEKGAQVGIVFGRESKGLSNEELQQCSSHLYIPSSEEYGVLNVAMAVQVVSYELRMRYLSVKAESQPKQTMPVEFLTRWDEPLANGRELQAFNEHLEQALLDIDFLNPGHPKQIIPRLKRLFSRARLDKSELNMLRGFLNSVQALTRKSV